MIHILLKEGDIIKEGDEFFSHACREWLTSRGIGLRVAAGEIFRRLLPTKPKVSLEELKEVALRVYRGNQVHLPLIQTDIEVIKSICTHLGIELELDKEEWERALEDYMTFGATTLEPTKIDRNIAKAMFEAGQACEKSKEK